MLPRPFPRDVVRDLLGIARALYRAERAKALPDPSWLARLADAGRLLRRALDMAGKHGPDTLGGRAALDWAEKGTEALGQLVADSEPIARAVAATAARLRRRR